MEKSEAEKVNRLKATYIEKIVPLLTEEFNYTNVHQVMLCVFQVYLFLFFYLFWPLTVINFRALSKVEETFGAYFPFFMVDDFDIFS